MGPVEYSPGDADLRQLVLIWYLRSRKAQLGHSQSASALRRVSWLLGISSAVLSALVGSAVLADVQSSAPVVVGLVGLLSASLIAVHTFMRTDDQVRQHEVASRAFGQIRRHLGQLGSDAGLTRPDLQASLSQIRLKYDEIAEGTPNVSVRIWARVSAASHEYFPDEFSYWPERRESQY